MSHSTSRILFASLHCLVDPSSGAGIATLDALGLLMRRGFHCRAFCASKLDAGNWSEEGGGRRWTVDGSRQVRRHRLMIGGQRSVELTHCTVGEIAGQVFETESPRIDQWVPGQPESMMAAFERVVADFRPDLLLTYGSDTRSRVQ